MAGGNTLCRQNAVADRCAGQQGGSSDHDVVVRVQANDGWRGHKYFLNAEIRLLTAF
jgi:hypothetical protein